MIHGNALGGGLEAALSSAIIIVERQAKLGFPEVLFNLFPGMGAYNLLMQRVSPSMTEKIILSGKQYSAQEFYELGVIDELVDEGGGESAVNSYIRSSRNRLNSLKAMKKVRSCVNPLSYQAMLDIGDIWVDAAMNLTEKEIRMMSKLVNSQINFASKVSNPVTSQALAY